MDILALINANVIILLHDRNSSDKKNKKNQKIQQQHKYLMNECHFAI